jgi:rhodanese-related sulfurtransferase
VLYWSVIDNYRSNMSIDWLVSAGITLDEAFQREERYLKAAMRNPGALAHRAASGRLSRRGRHEEAVAEARYAVAMDPNDPSAYQALATALVYAGTPTEAAESIRQAMRLDPLLTHKYLFWLGLAQFGMEHFEDAAETLTRSAHNNPDDDRGLIVLAAALGHLGRIEDAESAAAKANALRREKQQHLSDANLRAGLDGALPGPYTQEDVNMWPYKETSDAMRLREGLHLAGVPEVPEGANASPTEVPGATTIDLSTAKSLFDRGVAFVDVREVVNWKDGHVPGSINLELEEAFSETALSEIVLKDEEVVIHCAGPKCLRSSQACTKAVNWGFIKVYYFRAGFPAWKAAGYPIAVE